MEPGESLGRASTPEGGRIELIRHATRTVIYVDDLLLMSTDARGSEIAMANDCGALGPQARVLIGGLGLGFTLRAVLDAVPADCEVLQVELLSPLVSWHRSGLLGEHADHPVRDARVTVVEQDVVACLRESPDDHYDAVLLDVDNGPVAMTQNTNASLYDDAMMQTLKRVLRPGGHVVFWSADDFPWFTQQLLDAGYSARADVVSAWADDEVAQTDMQHVLFVASPAP
ncbi:MAG: hypothetical protein AB8I08_31475 [Sandaracinaceae bacterium]